MARRMPALGNAPGKVPPGIIVRPERAEEDSLRPFAAPYNPGIPKPKALP
jgi:hypothetical protein